MNFLIPGITDLIDIILVAFILYRAFLIVRKSGGYQILIGLLSIFGLYLLAYILKLQIVLSLLGSIKSYWILGLIILFQPELRNLIARLGQGHFTFNPYKKRRNFSMSPITTAISSLSFRKTGALIVIEKKSKLDEYIAKGEIIDAGLNSMLLITIFNPKTILHDGAVVIRNGRIYAVKVVLPLSENSEFLHRHGTRHLAAIGITEKTDAYVIVVSEETGAISFAKNGEIATRLSIEELTQRIKDEEQG